MAYCTRSDLALSIGAANLLRLVASEHGDTLDDTDVQAVLDDAIEQADALIDEALDSIASTPLETVPTAINGLSRRVAIMLLRERSPQTQGDMAQGQADEVTAELDALRNGERLYGVTRTVGLAAAHGSRNPVGSIPYTDGGDDDPEEVNDNLKNPLSQY